MQSVFMFQVIVHSKKFRWVFIAAWNLCSFQIIRVHQSKRRRRIFPFTVWWTQTKSFSLLCNASSLTDFLTRAKDYLSLHLQYEIRRASDASRRIKSAKNGFFASQSKHLFLKLFWFCEIKKSLEGNRKVKENIFVKLEFRRRWEKFANAFYWSEKVLSTFRHCEKARNLILKTWLNNPDEERWERKKDVLKFARDRKPYQPNFLHPSHNT